jgi:ribosome biogenesis protein BRX1
MFNASLQVLKEMLTQTFGVPSGHRAAKPFHDHIISFFYLDGRVWLRHYQVYRHL